MTHQDHTVTGLDRSSGPDQTAITICLVTGLPVPDGDLATLQQICTIRGQQIAQRGHTPMADAALPPAFLPRKAREYIDDAIDDVQRGKPEQSIVKLLKAGALILAAVARLRMNGSN